MKAKKNRRKKITREMVIRKYKVGSVFGSYCFRRWEKGQSVLNNFLN